MWGSWWINTTPQFPELLTTINQSGINPWGCATLSDLCSFHIYYHPTTLITHTLLTPVTTAVLGNLTSICYHPRNGFSFSCQNWWALWNPGRWIKHDYLAHPKYLLWAWHCKRTCLDVVMCILFYFYCIFPITIYSPYTPFPLQSPHCCPCPWVLFPFCSVPPAPLLLVQFVH